MGGWWEKSQLREVGAEAVTVVSDPELLPLLDVIVDGEFIEERKNLRLAFRGSENQRILDVQLSLKEKCGKLLAV